jgi:hypothetical protein
MGGTDGICLEMSLGPLLKRIPARLGRTIEPTYAGRSSGAPLPTSRRLPLRLGEARAGTPRPQTIEVRGMKILL